MANPRINAFNLGGWFALEEWIKPFDGIQNRDFMEGLKLQFKSVTQQKYLCAENGGGTNLVVNRVTPGIWETFKLCRISSFSFMLRVNGGQFVGLNNQGTAVATSTDPDNAHQKFEIVVKADFSRARIKAKNGNFLQAKTDVLVTADYSNQDTDWGDNDPSVFLLTRILDSQSGFGADLGLRVFADGTKLQFKSVTQKKYVCAEKGGGVTVVVNRENPGMWENFRPWRIRSNTFHFRVNNGQFLGLDGQGNLVATSTNPSLLDTFELVINRDDPSRVRILSKNGFFLQAKSNVLITADYDKETTNWGDRDPSVFHMTRIQGPQGDIQFLNAYTSDLDTKVLREGLNLQFKSVTRHKYLCAENGGGTNLVVNRVSSCVWETFKLWRISSSSFMLRVNQGQFVGLNNQGTVVATSTDPDNAHQKFGIVLNADFSRARIKAKNGNFLQAKTDVLVTADYSNQDTDWGDNDPSVFLLTRILDSQGKVKITSGLGADSWLRVLADGTKLQFKSVTQKKYVCAENGGGGAVVVNRENAGIWETFGPWRIMSNTFHFRVNNGQFIGLDGQGNLVATSTDPSRLDTFEVVINIDDPSRVRILSKNGFFLQAKSDVMITADYDKETTNWRDSDPSVFQLTRI